MNQEIILLKEDQIGEVFFKFNSIEDLVNVVIEEEAV